MNNIPVRYHLLKPPFLLKGSHSTEFIYKIGSETEILKFVSCKKSMFSNNLKMLDSNMPNLLSEALIFLRANNSTNINDIINQLEEKDPLNYNAPTEIKIYKYKVYEFLKGIILGLNSTKIWHGEPNIYDHLPVFKKNHELIYYSESNRNFIELIADDTYFDIGSVRHSKPYKIGREKFINLRLQLNLKT